MFGAVTRENRMKAAPDQVSTREKPVFGTQPSVLIEKVSAKNNQRTKGAEAGTDADPHGILPE